MKFSTIAALAVAGAAPAFAFPHMVRASPLVFLRQFAHVFPLSKLRDMGLENVQQFERAVRRDGPDVVRRMATADKRQVGSPMSIPLGAIPIPGLNVPTSIDIPYVVSVGTKGESRSAVASDSRTLTRSDATQSSPTPTTHSRLLDPKTSAVDAQD